MWRTKVTLLIFTIIFIVFSTAGCGNTNTHSTDSSAKKEIAFDITKWNDDPKSRYLMVEDLKQKYDFYSMTKEEIIDLLGTKSMHIGVDAVSYDMGGGYLNDEVLDFVFDGNGKVMDISIAN